jgi:membrane protease YdiL (CAAX protease family)
MEKELVERPGRTRTALVLAFAMAYPTVIAWFYFVVLVREGGPNPLQQLTYAAGKAVQFLLPLVFVLASERRRPSFGRPRPGWLAVGLGFGVLVAGLMLGLYHGWLRGSPDLAQTPLRIRNKLAEFGAATPAGYALLAAFIVVIHSFLEEYYWRWFVFGRLRALTPAAVAVTLSSLAFMAHHVIVLGVYLPGRFLSRVVPFSLCIAVGGAVWAWIYGRAGSLYPSWVSHLLVDAAIFVIGWDVLQRAGGL